MADSEPPRPTIFRVQEGSVSPDGGARVGHLMLPQRQPIDTPNFIAISSRGVVPHMTPDTLVKYSQVSASYIALEDFMDKPAKGPYTPQSLAHVVGSQSPSPALNTFTATPPNMATILGARRHPAVTAPMGNSKGHISIFASTGFQQLTNKEFCTIVGKLKADVTIPMADLAFGYGASKQKIPSAKRQMRMVERTEDWLGDFFRSLETTTLDTTSVFAPLLPCPYSVQWEYLNRLAEDHLESISGLAVYDADILADIGDWLSLAPLPRLSMDYLMTPQEVLRQVQLGVDIFTIPFLNVISDAGIALTFSFPPPDHGEKDPLPLGIDMSDLNHETAVTPLAPGCKCYVCTKHHRAFVHHLLNAREMLGWTLLQIHNHHIMSEFFAGIRSSLQTASPSFEQSCQAFTRLYEPELPKGTGERPRARGYHFKAEASQPKINRPAWEKYEDDSRADQTLADDAAKLAVKPVAPEGDETPLVPDADGRELNEKGFAEIDT